MTPLKFMIIAKVIVPLKVNGVFDYCADNFPHIKIGNLVRISFGNKKLVGLVLEVFEQNEIPYLENKKILGENPYKNTEKNGNFANNSSDETSNKINNKIKNSNDNNRSKNIKNIEAIVLEGTFSEKFISFLKRVSNYNMIPLGLVFKLAFSEKFIPHVKDGEIFYAVNDNYSNILFSQWQNGAQCENNKGSSTISETIINNRADEFNADSSDIKLPDKNNTTNHKPVRLTEKQKNIISLFTKTNPLIGAEELKNKASSTVIANLLKKNILIKISKNRDYADFAIDKKNIRLHKLSEEQEKVYEKIKYLLGEKKPILLEGATGSGKTEIYFHLFREQLEKADPQILFIVPEIALTHQFVSRFKSQFACKDLAVWHCEIGEARRRLIWNGVARGAIKIVIGTRSSLFLPFKNLSLVALDEEHDTSYYQTDNGCYNARDMAVLRSTVEGCSLILGSATPSLESLVNVEREKYNGVKLCGRFGATVPKIDIIDLKKDRVSKGKYLSQKLIDSMSEELSKGKQTLLFMNRRGYAPVIICSECGYRFNCPYCSITLTAHRESGIFLCHQCGYRMAEQKSCSNCKKENSLIFFGPGVEKIEEEVKELFPDRKTIKLTSDTTQNVGEIREILEKIQDGGVDIIIGTQLISKGYDFPKLTLVGVLDADASLFGANFRSAEKTYQLLAQISGRSGRRGDEGRAFLQTYDADNMLFHMLVENRIGDFLEFEKNSRKMANLPPYGRLVLLQFSGPNETGVYEKARELVNFLPRGDENMEIFGPTPAVPLRVAGNFRFRVIIKAVKNLNVQKLISQTLILIKIPSSIRLKINVDPYF